MSFGIDVSFANIASPVSGEKWRDITKEKRIDLITNAIQNFTSNVSIRVVEANKSGQVSLIINDIVSASERGPLLLDLETYLKFNIDNGITVWHAPIGDKSSLRNLRGIEVLS